MSKLNRVTTVLAAAVLLGACSSALSPNGSPVQTPTTANGASIQTPTTASACSGQASPAALPNVVGQKLGDATDGPLLCFNVTTATANTDGHNVMDDPANSVNQWVITALSPVPGTKVSASQAVTLNVKYNQTSAPVTVQRVTTIPVTAAPATAARCYPLTNSGGCYEPGEFCRTSDHGASGVAGDGEKVTCRDNNGWRWEPS